MPRRPHGVKPCRRPGRYNRTVACRVGDPAFPFLLTDAAGRVHSLESCRGAWLLLMLHRHLR